MARGAIGTLAPASALVMTVLAAGCSDASPTEPEGSGPGGGSSACRTYASAFTAVYSSSTGAITNLAYTCNYNRPTNETTCTVNVTDNRQAQYTQVTVTRYATIADAVGDAPRIHLYGTAQTHPMSGTVTTTAAVSGTTTSTLTYSYDGQGRPTSIVVRSSGAVAQTQTFTAWDTFGRPTAATADGRPSTYTYNDTDRMATATDINAAIVVTTNFDANGIQNGQRSVGPGDIVSSTWNIQSTATICR